MTEAARSFPERPPMTPDSSRLRTAVFVSGRGSNLQALLEARAGGRLTRVEFVLVFSDADAPKAFDHARAHGVDVFHLSPRAFDSKGEYEAAVLEELRRREIDFIVLAGYMRIVGPTLLGAYEHRMINIHPSLLPAFAGLHAQAQALEYGVKVSGCTVHFVDGGMDSGPVILQRAVEVRPDDTEASLSARILAEEHRALPQALEWISEGRVRVEGRRVCVDAPTD
jgi:phosphoribosylglycinamide formyltransferase 1